jgi:hypothetical protein
MADNGYRGKNDRPKSNKATGRDYSYDKKYQSSPEQVKNRTARNKARAEAIEDGVVKKGDRTKDIDHKKPLSEGGSNAKSNRRVMSASKNRARK